MKGRDALREMIGAGKPKHSSPEVPPRRVASGAVKAMNLGLQQLSDEAAAAKTLRATLASAQHVIELDPFDVDDSFIIDRIATDTDPTFTNLKAAIAAHGQQIPILVRPHPEQPKRYQAAYGHRRLRAARDLGISIKAIIRELSDAELVIAQGQENNERRDLSFIERAVFAAHLEQRQFDRDTITAALGVDKPELSRLLSVAVAVDESIILAIGPAPKIGRPRWLALASKMTDGAMLDLARQALATDIFRKADSNARFNLLLTALSDGKSNVERVRRPLNTPAGRRVAWLERAGIGLRLISEEAAFASFIEQRLPELLREFEDSGNDSEHEKGGTANPL